MKKILLLLCCLPFILTAQNADSIFIKKMSDDILTNGKAYNWLRDLCKNIGNRLSGSAAFNKAMDWGKTTMQQAGAGVVQLQECKVPHWVRGNNDEVKL